MVTAGIGIAGGVLLGRGRQRKPKLFGRIPLPSVKMPEVKVDAADLGKQIGNAGRQFGRLANEVQMAREKAEKISKALS